MKNYKRKITVSLYIICILAVSCMRTKENSVDQEKYLGNKTNSSEIYSKQGSKVFYSPFNLGISPMSRLMLIDIESETEYETIELQIYDDKRGDAATVILYKKDGSNDVYYTDSVFCR